MLPLEGKKRAEAIRQAVKKRVSTLGITPGLAVLLVGYDPASHTYVRIKQQACEEVGIRFELFRFEATASTEELVALMYELNHREDIHGILVQLPLPTQDADHVIQAMDPKKDVDGFHPENVKALEEGRPALVSPVALGVMKLLEGAALHPGMHACMLSSPLFARPFVALLKEREITLDVLQEDYNCLPPFQGGIEGGCRDLSEGGRGCRCTAEADLLITALGKPGILTAEDIKPGATVIDIGTTRIGEKLLGDVNADSVKPLPGLLTPVPGGVGPMTVAMLMNNVAIAATKQKAAMNGVRS